MQNLSPRHVKTEEVAAPRCRIRLVLDQGQRNLRLGPARFRGRLPAQDRRNRSAAGAEEAMNGASAQERKIGVADPPRRSTPMALERGSIKGLRIRPHGLPFSMMDGARKIPLRRQRSAMDDLEHVREHADSAKSNSCGCATGSSNARRANSSAGSSRARRPASSLRSIDFRNSVRRQGADHELPAPPRER